MTQINTSKGFTWSLNTILAIVAIGFILGMFLLPRYWVYSAQMSGKAEYEKAEQNRRVKVLEAQAKRDAAKLLAEADTIRATGIANSIEIMQRRLVGEAADKYTRWLWVNNLEGNQNVIYVPTENGIPIMEAGRGSAIHPAPAIKKEQQQPLFDWNAGETQHVPPHKP